MPDVDHHPARHRVTERRDHGVAVPEHAPDLPVIRVRDDVAGPQQVEHVVDQRRRVADMKHQGLAGELRRLARESHGLQAETPGVGHGGQYLDADQPVVAFEGRHRARQVAEVGPGRMAAADVRQARAADVDEGVGGRVLRLVDEARECVDGGRAGGTGVDDAGDALFDADAIRRQAAGFEQRVAEDVGVEVDEAGCDVGAPRVDDRFGRCFEGSDDDSVQHVDVTLPDLSGVDIDDLAVGDGQRAHVETRAMPVRRRPEAAGCHEPCASAHAGRDRPQRLPGRAPRGA